MIYTFFSCEDPAAIEQAEVDILTNGVDVNSRWEANVFKFVNKPVVHLHCKVRICFDTEDSQCSDVQNMCGNRKRRAVDGYLPAEDKVKSPPNFCPSVSPLFSNPTREDLLILGSRCIHWATYYGRQCFGYWR